MRRRQDLRFKYRAPARIKQLEPSTCRLRITELNSYCSLSRIWEDGTGNLLIFDFSDSHFQSIQNALELLVVQIGYARIMHDDRIFIVDIFCR